MTTSELSTLVEALRASWPDVKVSVVGAALVVETGVVRLMTPGNVDWRALSMEEWLHRINAVLRARLK